MAANLRDHLTTAKTRLVAAGIASSEAARDAQLLAMHALGWDRATLFAHDMEPPPPGFSDEYDALVARRGLREPIAYIRGVQEFWNRDFEVSPSVLIPRPETELIVEEALSCAFGLAADIGTGSGCLAVTLAAEIRRSRIVATDTSPRALETARANADRHHVAERVEFVETSYLDAAGGPFDLIVANPPYVSEAEYAALAPEVRDFEPRSALASGPEGLDGIRGVLVAAASHLRPGGRLLLEMGYRHAEAVSALVHADTRLLLLHVRNDLQRIPRMAVIERKMDGV